MPSILLSNKPETFISNAKNKVEEFLFLLEGLTGGNEDNLISGDVGNNAVAKHYYSREVKWAERVLGIEIQEDHMFENDTGPGYHYENGFHPTYDPKVFEGITPEQALAIIDACDERFEFLENDPIIVDRRVNPENVHVLPKTIRDRYYRMWWDEDDAERVACERRAKQHQHDDRWSTHGIWV